MKIAGCDLSISSSGIVIMELDDKFNVVNIERHGFVTTLKQQKLSPDMIYYNVKDYSCTYQRYQFFCDYILKWCKDCDIVAVEEYAMGKSGAQGLIFSLAEFEGNIKMSLFREGKKLRFYPPGTHKKFFTGKGNAGKIRPYQTYKAYKGVKFDISDLPVVVDDKKGNAPTSDLIDAYAICEMLRHELALKANVMELHTLTVEQIQTLTNSTDEHPGGLIKSNFDQFLI